MLRTDMFTCIHPVDDKSYTVKPVNKGHPREEKNMVFINKWSLFGGYFVLFYQVTVIEVWPLFTGWSLFRCGL